LKFVIVVDDENNNVEGNLIKAASLISTKDVAFMIKHGSGIVSVGMKEEDLQRLNLPLMSPETEEEDSSAPTFTITVVSKISYSILKPNLDCCKYFEAHLFDTVKHILLLGCKIWNFHRCIGCG